MNPDDMGAKMGQLSGGNARSESKTKSNGPFTRRQENAPRTDCFGLVDSCTGYDRTV